MKVVFFQPYLANWRIQFLERFIKDSKHEVVVFDGGFSSKNDKKSVSNNETSFEYKKLFSFSPVLSVRGQDYPLYFSPGLLLSLIKHRPDVVVTEGEINFINNISVFLYCFVFRKRYVWWSLGKVRTRQKNILNKILDPVIDFLLHRASCVMARTSWAKEYYVHDKFIPECKVIVAPNSMDEKRARSEVDQTLVEELKKQSIGKIVLYVGALTKEKRPEDLIRAVWAAKNKPDGEAIDLWFVGDGPEKGDLLSLSKSLGLENNVRFFGKIFDGVGSYFSAADIVVVPGLGGLVINHAMIFGKPVVSRLADGTELDLVKTGETGVLLDSYDIDELADAICTVLSPKYLNDMSANARAAVDEFWNIETMIDRVHQCIEFQQ